MCFKYNEWHCNMYRCCIQFWLKISCYWSHLFIEAKSLVRFSCNSCLISSDSFCFSNHLKSISKDSKASSWDGPLHSSSVSVSYLSSFSSTISTSSSFKTMSYFFKVVVSTISTSFSSSFKRMSCFFKVVA